MRLSNSFSGKNLNESESNCSPKVTIEAEVADDFQIP
jgi:hypothetical protein